jgi:hypothetical protein
MNQEKLKEYHETTSEIIDGKEYLKTTYYEPKDKIEPTIADLRKELGLK